MSRCRSAEMQNAVTSLHPLRLSITAARHANRTFTGSQELALLRRRPDLVALITSVRFSLGDAGADETFAAYSGAIADMADFIRLSRPWSCLREVEIVFDGRNTPAVSSGAISALSSLIEVACAGRRGSIDPICLLCFGSRPAQPEPGPASTRR